jgi:hypothetical protein
MRRERVIVSLVTASLVSVLGCGSRCSSGSDGSGKVDLTSILSPAGDAGAQMSCSQCPNPVIHLPGCRSDCELGRDAHGYAITQPCVFEKCVDIVRDTTSSCASVCAAVGYGSDRGCAFGPARTFVTCNYHVNGSCRCDLVDC